MSLRVQRPPDVSEFRRRFRWLALFAFFAFLVILARMVELQVLFRDDYQAIARENIVRKLSLATTRGIIRDRNGEVLAANRPAYNVFVEPMKVTRGSVAKGVPPTLNDIWRKLSSLSGILDDERMRHEERLLALRESGGNKATQQVLIMEDVSRDAAATLMTHARELPGVHIVPVSVRYYPHGAVGAHVLGYMREVDGEMLVELRKQGYAEGDRIGASGVERAWESYLRGARGWEKVIVDARGARRPARDDVLEEPKRADPLPGRDLRLTLDVHIQEAIVKAMRGELAGAAALVEVKSGRILGLVSKPSYDPNQLSGGFGKKVVRDAFQRLFNDPLKTAIDKTVSGAFPPGSTFKPFTALAALEKGLIDHRVNTVCRGFMQFGRRIFRCTHSHGPTDLHKGLAQSCNVYFYRLVSEFGVTMDMIADVGRRFGFGQRSGLALNGESSGRMPTRAWMTLRNKGQFRHGFTLNAALGQGATTVTVLQLALAYAALANGGTLYQPQLVTAVDTAGGAVVQEFVSRVRRRIEIAPRHGKLIAQALWGGVNEEGGTSHRARLAGVDVAGKTGSAQVSHKLTSNNELENVWYFNRDHAWFAGYAPSGEPEVAVVVLIEHGGAGGRHAAPVAFEIIQAYQLLRAAEKAGTAEKAGAAVVLPQSPSGARAP
ncbi:MAG: penicillin-binding protein 2 [Myxococcales bacterium]|nr:penicillin-binding protein 2 [Myxococcales bacterium]